MQTIKQVVFWGVVGLNGATIATGLLGLITAKAKTCCSIGLYSFCTLMLTLAMLVIGGILMTVTVASNMQIDQFVKGGALN